MQDEFAVTGEKADATAHMVRLEPLPELDPGDKALFPGRMDLIGDLKVRVRAVLGEGEISVATLFGLKDGSIVPLECGVHPLVDIELDGKTIARGELVVVDDALGVRLTEVGDALAL
jgi:flagellar motor switch protein FliN